MPNRLTTDIVWAINLFILQNITYGTRQLRHGSYKLHHQCGQQGDPIASIALYKPVKSSTEGYLWTTSSPLEKANVSSLKSPIEEHLWATSSPLKEQTLTVRVFLSKVFVKMILSFSLLALSSVVTAVNFDWNCQNSLGPCNNACFRVNCRGTPLPFNYDSNVANRGPRRTRSGCNRTPCTNTGYGRFGNSCDEFPFASVTQGGTGATLRCVDSTENSSMYTKVSQRLIEVISWWLWSNIKVKEVSSRPFIGACKTAISLALLYETLLGRKLSSLTSFFSFPLSPFCLIFHIKKKDAMIKEKSTSVENYSNLIQTILHQRSQL